MQSGNNGNVQKPAGEIKIRMARKLHPIMQAMPRITKCHAKESMLSPEVVWRPAMGRLSGFVMPRFAFMVTPVCILLYFTQFLRDAMFTRTIPTVTDRTNPTVAVPSEMLPPSSKPFWAKTVLKAAAVPCPPENPIGSVCPKYSLTPKTGTKKISDMNRPTNICIQLVAKPYIKFGPDVSHTFFAFGILLPKNKDAKTRFIKKLGKFSQPCVKYN